MEGTPQAKSQKECGEKAPDHDFVSITRRKTRESMCAAWRRTHSPRRTILPAIGTVPGLPIKSKNHRYGGRNLHWIPVQERRLVMPLADRIHCSFS